MASLARHLRGVQPHTQHLRRQKRQAAHPSSSSTSATSVRSLSLVFDRKLKARQRDAAAANQQAHRYDYLKDEIAHRLVDRLDDIHATYTFPHAVDLGAGSGHVRRALAELAERRKIASLTEYDASREALARSAADAAAATTPHAFARLEQRHVDEEDAELEPASCDLILSSMALHWVNDLPGTLAKIRRALKPNGLFLAAFLGGETLAEMRSALVLADLERNGGVAPHMSPLVSVADASALLQSSGFALPTVDTEEVRIGFPDAWTAWHHLRCMGESNATARRAPHDQSDYDTLLAAAAAYSSVYGDGESIPASFQVIYLIGWAPHESQARPLPRGSGKVPGTVSLKELGLDFPEPQGPPEP